jgi:methyl-accepting chemotaxis protein
MEEITSTSQIRQFGQSVEAQVDPGAYFRFHGLMAPGVRSFRQLRFHTKALLITLAFVVPLALLTWFYTSARLAMLDSTAQEREGVVDVRNVVELIKLGQARRRLTIEAASSGKESTELASVAQAVAAQWTIVKSDPDSQSDPVLTTMLKELGEANDAAAVHSAGLFKVYATHSKFLNKLTEYAEALADSSNLTLDPDLDTYYLMDAGILNLPTLINSLARMRGLAAAAALSGQGGDIAGAELTRLDAVVEQAELNLKRALGKVVGVHPAFQAEFNLEAVLKVVDQLREITMDEPGSGGEAKARQIAQVGKGAVDALWQLQGQTVARLDELLAVRQQGVKRGMWITYGVIGLSMVLATYLFFAFYLVMTGGMNEVRRYLQAIAAGDLSGQPKAWGQDEAADLLRTLCDMQCSLADIVTEVRVQSDQIIHASFEIANGATELTQRTGSAAMKLQEAAASIEEIAVTVKLGADNAGEVAHLASDNASVASRGGQVMQQVAATMSDINTASSRIGEIIGVIDGIAFQTNILALNAAVEAARAGEHGKGFAVVASEVRALAQRSSAAAREIKVLITSSMDKVVSGTKVVGDANHAIQELVTNANRINELIDAISSGGKEQAVGIELIGASISDLNAVTQSNAQLAGGNSGLADKLTDSSSELLQRVALFKLQGD